MRTGDRWHAGGDLRRAATTGVLVGAWIAAVWVAVNATVYYVTGDGVGMDAHAYWLAGRLEHPYGPAPEARDAFLYSPLFAQVMRPFSWLPWVGFCAGAMAVEAVAYLWLAAPLAWRWRIPVLLCCVPEWLIGNIYPLLAVALVLGLARPWPWAFPALTKITPAVVGPVWFAARREWRLLFGALLTLGLLCAASFALDPHLWIEWVIFLADHGGERGISYPVRVLLAVGLTVYAGRADKPWILAFTYYLAMPLAGLGLQSMVTIVAVVRIAARRGAAPVSAAGQASAVRVS